MAAKLSITHYLLTCSLVCTYVYLYNYLIHQSNNYHD